MALVKPTIYQIVGYQNSGKTTFIKKLLHEIMKENLTAVTIKHHGHGGKPALSEDKDSVQHIQAGAIASLVEGEGRLLLHAENMQWSLNEKIQFLSFFKPDIILIEGHKYEAYKKAVLLRKKEDVSLLETCKNIQMVFYWEESLIETFKKSHTIPNFHINDQNGYKWFVEELRKEQATEC